MLAGVRSARWHGLAWAGGQRASQRYTHTLPPHIHETLPISYRIRVRVRAGVCVCLVPCCSPQLLHNGSHGPRSSQV